METEKENEIQALTEKVEQLENQLKDKDVVITKEVEKGHARLRAYVDCLAELTDCQAKAKILEASLHNTNGIYFGGLGIQPSEGRQPSSRQRSARYSVPDALVVRKKGFG
ncbi:unnamed protein product [Pleuronectes platessa]|uniref:Uncharacterized protein n=1 Tax=Pleuronectes platessa TaxID=8262 RepID=A0A9N7YM12_PLEPL|nr:unnamed protein product [Pleuronectes platessa]